MTGRVVLITTYNAGRQDSAGCATPCPRTPHVQYSDDDGMPRSTPQDIAGQASMPNWDSWYASGPGHGIQLTHGPHAGRLVFGVNAETSDGATSIANHGGLVYPPSPRRRWCGEPEPLVGEDQVRVGLLPDTWDALGVSRDQGKQQVTYQVLGN